jgi:DNA uptake protein ComE-like DNA-binding protein
MRMGWILSALAVSALSFALTGCNACYNNSSPTPEQVRQKTADATATIKDDAKALGEGVREGLTRPTSEHPVDLNSASKSQLTTLPGIDDAAADRIIAGRPYSSEHQLLDKHIVSRDEYTKIADSVTVKK